MDTRNGLSVRLLGALAMRPAGPGLVLVAGVLALAVAGEPLTTVPWFWPASTTIVVPGCSMIAGPAMRVPAGRAGPA